MVNLKFWTWFEKKEQSEHEKFMLWLEEQTLQVASSKGREINCHGIALAVAKNKKVKGRGIASTEDLQLALQIQIKGAIGDAKQNYRQTLIEVESLPPYIPQ
jgi:hypothetical protein